ncbi:interleukin-31 receptor subunit alpha-like isoform X2 [Gouania willdenowi]|nr:interleukin-31 receptor subunit alpha-like isoform X2 [Gouania willdenowi]
MKSTNCTLAVFKGSPKSLFRCGPPKDVSFTRLSGKLHVNVEWHQEDMTAIGEYSVRYRAKGARLWSKSTVRSDNSSSCMVENLNTSQVYEVQIECLTNLQCSQCPWSEAYMVPHELTEQPVIVNLWFIDIDEKKGKRWTFVSWKLPDTETHHSYCVSIWKTSGETPSELRINTSRSEISLILSFSSYRINISAFNDVSTSPAVSRTIPQRDGTEGGLLNVTVHHNNSFTIHWRDDLIKSYVCFSAEWRTKTHKGFHESFHEQDKNYKTISPLPEPLEPFKRYTLTLHTRTNNETCNMVHINNSESTYGSKPFYFIEGSPVSAPTNVSVSNVTLTSALLFWTSIPEEDTRGFLLGYIIYYKKYDHKKTSTENNVTVDPSLNVYELENLQSGTPYQVQISGFTSGGTGVRSTASFFKTNLKANVHIGGIIGVFAFVILVTFGSPLIKRAKTVLWPSIPNPGNSDTMQKIFEQAHLEAIGTLTVEEWHSGILQVLQRSDIEDHTEASCSGNQEEAENVTGEESREDNGDVFFLDTKQTNVQSSTCALVSGYTTMEMFQQGMSTIPTERTQHFQSKAEHDESSGSKQRLDYVRQFSEKSTVQ